MAWYQQKTQLIRRAAPKKTPGTDADIERHDSDAAPCGVGKAPWAAQKGSTGCAVGGWRKKGRWARGGRQAADHKSRQDRDPITRTHHQKRQSFNYPSTRVACVAPRRRTETLRACANFPASALCTCTKSGCWVGFSWDFGMHVASPPACAVEGWGNALWHHATACLRVCGSARGMERECS